MHIIPHRYRSCKRRVLSRWITQVLLICIGMFGPHWLDDGPPEPEPVPLSDNVSQSLDCGTLAQKKNV
jgi:hypothetical protein